MCLYLHLHYKFRSSTITGKQYSASLNVTSVHLSAFVDFVNIFIRYRPNQSTSELSLIATEMISTTSFFRLCHFSHPPVHLSIRRTPYLRNLSSSDHNFWYTCVKWWSLQGFFHFFNFWSFGLLEGYKGKK